MIVAVLNQPHGVGKMTLALHPAGLWSYRTRHVTVIDADPQGRTLEWSEMWAQERLPSRFTVIGLTRNTLHRDAQNIASSVQLSPRRSGSSTKRTRFGRGSVLGSFSTAARARPRCP